MFQLTERLIAKHGAAGLPTLPKASDDDEYEEHEQDDTRLVICLGLLSLLFCTQHGRT